MKILAAVFVLALTLQAAKRPLTTDTSWDFRAVGDPQINKDGSKVIYTLTWADKMNDAYYSNLWIATIDQSGKKDERPLTTGSFRDTSPRLSPDNTRLAYISNRGG